MLIKNAQSHFLSVALLKTLTQHFSTLKSGEQWSHSEICTSLPGR
ncbi:hypothetical protein NRI_0639 [Neorickettsia risticii str. Illinois]|uniref:Uncharacterized protein n=1 Tax=Neorickettsia risticii (strain Illinois) TaxID=434131 RepID=C6V5E8_NEORI|nr:hypothetical protein NRI_0639 [Neorickettsia risticii str. Illinois]